MGQPPRYAGVILTATCGPCTLDPASSRTPMIRGTEVRTCASNHRSRRSRGFHPRPSRGSPSSRSRWASPTTTTRRPITSSRSRRCREADRFRFANRLTAWIEVDDGRIAGHGQAGGGQIGSTTISLGGRGMTFAAVAFPDRRPAPVVGDGWVRFTQTAGGRTGVPAPRKVNRPPFVQVAAPLAWTTLTLTHLRRRNVDARADRRQSVPAPLGLRPRREPALRSRDWWTSSAGISTPSASTRRGATRIHRRWSPRSRPRSSASSRCASCVAAPNHASRPSRRARRSSTRATRASDMYLLLDGVLSVEVDGTSGGPGRTRRGARRAGAARGWPANRDAPRVDRVQGCRRIGARGVPRDAQRAGCGASPRSGSSLADRGANPIHRDLRWERRELDSPAAEEPVELVTSSSVLRSRGSRAGAPSIT